MKKTLIFLLLIMFLAGCANLERSAKTITDNICEMSDAEKNALAERFDGITSPNKIRVICAENK